MAQGLRCPHCGHKHPIADLDGAATFTCSGCGQVLKTPRQYRTPSPSPSPSAPPAPSAPPRVSRPNPTPRAREMPRARTLPPVAGNRETAVLPQATVPSRGRVAPSRERSLDRSSTLPWPWRVLVWVVAVPLGLVIVAVPARWLGVLNGNSFFDVISGTGIGRYLRIFSIAPFAALVIATIAHVALEQLPEFLARRRALAREAAQLRQPGQPAQAPQRVRRASGRRTS